MNLQFLFYSSYKSRYIVKVVICVLFNGVFVFLFDLYFGLILDVVIVDYCGVLQQLKVGDFILVDKGFNIYDKFFFGVFLNILLFFL